MGNREHSGLDADCRAKVSNMEKIFHNVENVLRCWCWWVDTDTLIYIPAWVEKINYHGFIDSGMFEDRPCGNIGQMSSNPAFLLIYIRQKVSHYG